MVMLMPVRLVRSAGFGTDAACSNDLPGPSPAQAIGSCTGRFRLRGRKEGRVTQAAACGTMTGERTPSMPLRAPSRKMTADEFIEWAMGLPDGERYELVGGHPVAMAPERVSHARAKGSIYVALRTALDRAKAPCEAFPDGMSVEIDEAVVYEPDALVRCGERLPDETVRISDPVIVVEVVSPASRAYDLGAKLEGYFRLPSVRHYLIVKTDTRSVIHHHKDEEGRIQTRIVREGTLLLAPPGIEVEIASFFA
jgi:Uma2 family endonuclease